MKNNLFILLCVLPFFGIAQNDSVVDAREITTFKNQIDLDIHFLAAEFTYKRRVSEKIFMDSNM